MLAHLATLVALAAPVTTPATNVTPTTATLNGTDDTNATTVFHYGTTTAKTLTTDPVVVTGGVAHADVAGLSANTTYHFAIDGGQDLTFKTAPNPTPPLVSDQHATAVTTAGAHLAGKIDPKGAETTYYFQYGRSSSYGNRTAQVKVPAGDPIAVAADISALRPYTLYHWRLFARNAAGNTPGRDHTFRTGRLATAVTFYSARAKVQYGSGVTLGGRVSGAGINQMTLALQQERFPFGTGFRDVRTTHAGQDGGFLFDVDHVWGLTRFRVVTQTQTPLTSTVAPVRVTPRTTIGVRNLAASAPASPARCARRPSASCRCSAGWRPASGRRSSIARSPARRRSRSRSSARAR